MSLSELHTERVDADQSVAAIIDSMSDRDQEGVTPAAAFVAWWLSPVEASRGSSGVG